MKISRKQLWNKDGDKMILTTLGKNLGLKEWR